MTKPSLILLLGLTSVLAVPREIVLNEAGGGSKQLRLAEDEVVQKTKGKRTRLVRKSELPQAYAPAFASSALPDEAWSTGTAAPLQPVYYIAGQPRNDTSRRILTSQIILTLPEGGDQETVRQTLEILGIEARVPEYSKLLVFATLPDPESAMGALPDLQGLPGVATAELAWARSLSPDYTPNDPLFSGSGSTTEGQSGHQWYLDPKDARNLGLTGWWDSYRGQGIRVNVVDDGIETAHPDLTANVNRDLDKDYWDDDGDPNPAEGDKHGTAVAGIIGGRGNNGKGITGIAPECSLIGVRLDFVSSNRIEIGDVLKHKSGMMDVSNNSWGIPSRGVHFSDIGPAGVEALRDGAENGRGGRGLIYVVSAGNEGGTPAASANRTNFGGSPFVLTVGALGPDGGSAGFSSPGANVGVSAWGENVTTTTAEGQYRTDFNGTSAAAPVTSGVVALMLNARPTLGWRDVQDILMRTAIKPKETTMRRNGAGYSFEDKVGAGRVSGERAIRLARRWDLLGAGSTAETSYNTVVGITDAKLDKNQLSVPGLTNRTLKITKNLRTNSVLLTMQCEHGHRGDLEIYLTSPSGMVSQMLTASPSDDEKRLSWTFRSVQFWGENSAGDWKVRVVDTNPGPVAGDDRILEMKLRVLGTNAPGHPSPRGETLTGRKNQAFWHETYASGNPSSFSATGLPPGLSIDDLGAISGTPQTAGVYSVQVSASNASGTGTAGVTINVESDLTPFAEWQKTELASMPPESQGPDADADGDGVPNLVEYATGGNPLLRNDTDGLQLLVVDGQSQLIWHERYGDKQVRLVLEESSDMTSWAASVDLPLSLPDETRRRLTLPLSSGAGSNRFFRLRAY